MGKGYSSIIPPVSLDDDFNIVPLEVNISLVLINILNINEVENIIQVKFRIILQWRDDRITYQNLKLKTYLNALKPKDIETLWIPYVIFRNTDDNEATKLRNGIKNIDTSITVQREGNFTSSDIDILDEIEFFQGRENTLTMNQTYTKDFHCFYKFEFYPFDTQVNIHKIELAYLIHFTRCVVWILLSRNWIKKLCTWFLERFHWKRQRS